MLPGGQRGLVLVVAVERRRAGMPSESVSGVPPPTARRRRFSGRWLICVIWACPGAGREGFGDVMEGEVVCRKCPREV
ncbi:unnamed protein product [Darwinula stevensoni]|uniref:Uncharacterized protein n=1 Tax=Darwinula stevensoni TaxID=69355 RepID=A0A7R8X6Y4_9CRUS|nr:unnamed protein product [Darwinula stevensoni]CAG0879927.1 unnamed protein product [Darwinula stevensoni]